MSNAWFGVHNKQAISRYAKVGAAMSFVGVFIVMEFMASCRQVKSSFSSTQKVPGDSIRVSGPFHV